MHTRLIIISFFFWFLKFICLILVQLLKWIIIKMHDDRSLCSLFCTSKICSFSFISYNFIEFARRRIQIIHRIFRIIFFKLIIWFLKTKLLLIAFFILIWCRQYCFYCIQMRKELFWFSLFHTFKGRIYCWVMDALDKNAVFICFF